MANFDDLLQGSPAEGQSGGAQLSKEEYAAKMKAARDEVYALADNTALEVAGDGGKLRQFLDVQARFGRYSANNALLILAQKPDATRFGELKYWKTQKVFIKQSEIKNGFTILKQGDEYRRKDGGVGVSYDPVTVYDISQAERKILPSELPTHDERTLLGAFVKKSPVAIKGADELPDDLGAMTDPETGEITVRRGMEFADTFSSLATELAYADLTTGADTPQDPRFSAYCAAYLLCKSHGVDTKGFSFAEAPAAFEGMDAQAVKAELTQIRDAANGIAARTAPQLNQSQKTDKAAKNNEAR